MWYYGKRPHVISKPSRGPSAVGHFVWGCEERIRHEQEGSNHAAVVRPHPDT